MRILLRSKLTLIALPINWMSANHLCLNPQKTKLTILSRNRHKLQPILLLNGTALEQVTHFKYLGIWVSDDLTWNNHIEAICNKAQRHLGFIFRMFSPYCSPENIIHLYRAQGIPVLEYGCIVWDSHLQKNKLLLEKIQLFATCMASKDWSADAKSLNTRFKLPTLSSRRSYFKMLYTYKLLNSILFCPIGFSCFHPNPNLRVFHSRQLVCKNQCFTSFFISEVKLWNPLPEDLVTCTSIGQFKTYCMNVVFEY